MDNNNNNINIEKAENGYVIILNDDYGIGKERRGTWIEATPEDVVKRLTKLVEELYVQ